MASFLYYLPKHAGVASLEQLEALGLAYAFEARPAFRGLTGGPDGGDGVIVAEKNTVGDVLLGYFPDRQTWRKIPRQIGQDDRIDRTDPVHPVDPVERNPGGGDCWVGMYHGDDRPAPADLARREQLPGYIVPLAGDRSWHVPVCRQASEAGDKIERIQALPRRMELDDAGGFIAGEVVPGCATLDSVAVAYFEAFEAAADPDAEEVRFEFDVDTAAVTVLAANYRLSKVEIVLLGLFTFGGSQAATVMNIAIDLPGWWAIKKKQASGISASEDGSPAGTPVTGPA